MCLWISWAEEAKEVEKKPEGNQHLNVKVQLRLQTIQTIVERCFNSLLFYRYRNLPPEMRQIVSQQQQNSSVKAALGNDARTNVTLRDRARLKLVYSICCNGRIMSKHSLELTTSCYLQELQG